MRKSELVAEIANLTKKERAEVSKILETFLHCVKKKLSEGEDVHLRGFGSFAIKDRAAKKAQDILNKTTIVIPACKIPAFKPSKQFVEIVRKESLKNECDI